MSQTAVEDARRRSRGLLLAAVAIWTLLAVVLPLGALTLNALPFAGYPLGFWIAAQGAPIGLAAVALVYSWRARASRGREGWGPPLALAGEAVGAAAVVGFAGAVAALGYDGLALSLGLIAGLALMAIAVAPRYSLYPANSLSEFFAARFGGVWPRRIALFIAATASILLLAANLRAGALAVQGLISADYANGAAIMSAAVALVWLAGSALGARLHPGVFYAALLIGVLAALSTFAARYGDSALSYFAYADAMRELSAMEQKLVAGKLSDMASLRPMSSPFLQASMQNFLGLVLAVALGVAALPHLLRSGGSNPALAGRRAAIATAWATLLLMGLVALAVYSRIGLAELIGQGLPAESAPTQLLSAHGLNWVKICGTASGADLAAACSTLAGQRGVLRMQDLAFASDAFIVAAPWLSGLPTPAVLSFWAAIAVSAIAAGATILKGYADAAGDGDQSIRGSVCRRCVRAADLCGVGRDRRPRRRGASVGRRTGAHRGRIIPRDCARPLLAAVQRIGSCRRDVDGLWAGADLRRRRSRLSRRDVRMAGRSVERRAGSHPEF